MRFYTTIRLGPKRFKTPEGFLVLQDVPVARTGEQLYGADEVPVTAGPDGLVHIERDPEEIFRPETIASANGKAFVDDHPPEEVTPETWAKYAKGHATNPRRGTGMEENLLLLDIVVTDPPTIEGVEANVKTEISCGYDCDYEEIEPGRGRQKNIVINHIAWVRNARCGSQCAIKDHRTTDCSHCQGTCGCQKEKPMSKAKPTLLDTLMRAFKAKDASEVEKIAEETKEEHDEAMGGGVNVHLHGGASGEDHEYCSRDAFEAHVQKNDDEHKAMRDDIEALKTAMAKKGEEDGEGEGEKEVEGELKEEAPPGTGDAKIKGAKDSILLLDTFQSTAALAEIIAPGIRIPTFDKALEPKKGLDVLDTLRCTTLELANGQPETRGLIEAILGKPLNLKAMTRDSRRTLFRSVAEMKKRANNDASKVHESIQASGGGTGVAGDIQTPADINRLIRERKQGKAA